MKSHDQNFKNLFSDFPRQALEWILPQAVEELGNIHKIEFLRQEPKKRKLSDPLFILDLSILFHFARKKLLLWLLEFQEEKSKFSAYKIAHYTLDMMEAHPDAVVIPTVLFTDRKKWRGEKDVTGELSSKFGKETFLYFRYVFIRLFEYQAKDYYDSPNPLARILLPKMDYPPEERITVIQKAWKGLYELTNPLLFEKYLDFIDIYAEIKEDEKEMLFHELSQKEETVMLAQYIKQKGYDEGIQQGIQEGIQKGIQEGIRQGKKELKEDMVLRSLKAGLEIELIQKLTGLGKKEILEIQQKKY